MNRLKCMIMGRTASIFVITTLLGVASIFGQSAKAQDERPYVFFEGTASPDGRYAVAWGIPYRKMDVSDMDKLIAELNLEALENFLVDTKTGRPVATLGTQHFPQSNHGSLATLWRDDSKAVVVVEGGKWGFRGASVIYIVDPEGESEIASDPIPLSNSLRRGVKAKLIQDHPEEKAAIEQFAVAVNPVSWVDDEHVLFATIGQVPKSEDAFFFEGDMTFKLTGPETAMIESKDSQARLQDTGGELKITSNSAGPIKLGMTVSKAKAAFPTANFQRSSDGEGIALIEVAQNGNTLMGLYAGEGDPTAPIDENAVIEFIQVWSPDFLTVDGIHVGMTVSHAEKSGLGEVNEVMMSELESREYATFANQPSGLTFRVIHDRGTAGMYRDGAMTSPRATPGATIFRIEVTGADIMQDGSIGGIKIDSPEAEVLGIAGQNVLGEVLKGKDEIWAAFGQAVQKWLYPDSGLELQMLSDEIGGPKTVFSITVKAPCELRTGRGIKIGDDKARVLQAYADYKTHDEGMDGFFEGKDVHLVGSIYGGMIFTFQDGRVSEIFLGAAAE